MPGSKDNVNLNYLLLLFLLFLTKWISQTVFLSFARQEPNCTFQPRALARFSSSARPSFHFSLDLIIFQPGLLPAPILKITLKGICEQPREWLRCCKALLLCQSGCPLLFLCVPWPRLVPLAVDKGPATGSAVPNLCKLLRALSNVFPLMFGLSHTSSMWDACELWGHFRGVWVPWDTPFPAQWVQPLQLWGRPPRTGGVRFWGTSIAHITLETELISTPYEFSRH